MLLMSVTNYQGIDIQFHHTPIILRRFHPINVESDSIRTQFIPWEIASKVENTGTKISLNISEACSSEYYFTDDVVSKEFCIRIWRHKFTLKSKPWNFEINAYLLPPMSDVSH